MPESVLRVLRGCGRGGVGPVAGRQSGGGGAGGGGTNATAGATITDGVASTRVDIDDRPSFTPSATSTTAATAAVLYKGRRLVAGHSAVVSRGGDSVSLPALPATLVSACMDLFGEAVVRDGGSLVRFYCV
jgi:hypothetical protein